MIVGRENARIGASKAGRRRVWRDEVAQRSGLLPRGIGETADDDLAELLLLSKVGDGGLVEEGRLVVVVRKVDASPARHDEDCAAEQPAGAEADVAVLEPVDTHPERLGGWDEGRNLEHE